MKTKQLFLTCVLLCSIIFSFEATAAITVKFLKPSSWENVYLHAWEELSTGPSDLFGGWPGQQLDDTDGDGWYTYTFDDSFAEIDFIFNVQFQSGKVQQTSDLYTDTDVCYIWEETTQADSFCELLDSDCDGQRDDIINIDGIYYHIIGGDAAEVTYGSDKYVGDINIPTTINYNNMIYRITSIGKYAFQNCSQLTSITMGENIRTIGREAFENCYSLISLSIPENVNRIGVLAFSGCWSLTTISCLASTPPVLSSRGGISSETIVQVPCSSLFLYKMVNSWSELNLQSISTFDKTITTLSSNEEYGSTIIFQTPSCENGGRAIIEAWPKFGYKFTAWNDGNTENPRTITVTEDTTLTAHFERINVTGVQLNYTISTVEKGQTLSLQAIVQPHGVLNTNVSWESNNLAVAKVDNTGLVTAISDGTAIITVTTEEGGYKATCEVNVKTSVVGVSLNHSNIQLKPKESVQLIATITPEDATDKTISWYSNNSEVAIVNDGLVLAVGTGLATITVTTVDGEHQATCEIYVYVPVSGVTLDKTSLVLTPKSAEQLVATILPANATNQDYTWSVDDSSIVNLMGEGWIIAVAEGTTNVIVTTEDGNYKAICEVIVQETIDAVENIVANNALSVSKVLENGTIYILRNGEKYTIDGRKVK